VQRVESDNPSPVELEVAVPSRGDLVEVVLLDVVSMWPDRGFVIDARGSGPPILRSSVDLAPRVVITLTRDGDFARRSGLPDPSVASYAGAVLRALAGGASASTADVSAYLLVAD